MLRLKGQSIKDHNMYLLNNCQEIRNYRVFRIHEKNKGVVFNVGISLKMNNIKIYQQKVHEILIIG